jgi:hypothetical protein
MNACLTQTFPSNSNLPHANTSNETLFPVLRSDPRTSIYIHHNSILIIISATQLSRSRHGSCCSSSFFHQHPPFHGGHHLPVHHRPSQRRAVLRELHLLKQPRLRVVRQPGPARRHAALQLHGRHQHRARGVPRASGQEAGRVGGVGAEPERHRHGGHPGRGGVPALQREPGRVPDAARQLRAVDGALQARGAGVPGVRRGRGAFERQGDGGVRDGGVAGEGEQVQPRVAAGELGGRRRARGAPHHGGQHPLHGHRRFQQVTMERY